MKPKPHVFVPLSAEGALSRLEGRTATVAEILLSAAPDFYSPQDVPAGEWAQQRLVHVSRHEGELKLRLPRGETGQGRLGIEEQVWLLAGAARPNAALSNCTPALGPRKRSVRGRFAQRLMPRSLARTNSIRCRTSGSAGSSC